MDQLSTFLPGTTDSVLKATCGPKIASLIAADSFRVLTPGGVCVQVTDEDPDTRMRLLQEALPTDSSRLSFKVVESDSYEYFLY